MTLFQDIHDRADGNEVISLGLLADQAARRWSYSIAHNPHFYYGPVSGMVSRNAGYLFLGRLLSNHTKQHPEGILTQATLRKFFAVQEDSKGELQYREGHESIPENWYRTKTEYGLAALNADIVSWVLKHPELGRYVFSTTKTSALPLKLILGPSIGGNTGTLNSFSGLNLQDITSGVLNASSLSEGNNLLCFVFEVLKTFLPNSLSPLLSTLEVPINLVTDTIAAPILSLACPAWKDLTDGGEPLWEAIQRSFPGAKNSGSSL